MKFNKHSRHPFIETQRKRSYVLVRQRREREALPLFADAIAETQPSVDHVMAERAQRWTASEAQTRSRRARAWIIVRRMLKLLPDHERRAFLEYYYRVRYPLDGGYMRTVLLMALDGRLVMVDGQVCSQSELNFRADRAAKIQAMTDAELDRRIQSPYAMPAYLDELRAERARRVGL